MKIILFVLFPLLLALGRFKKSGIYFLNSLYNPDIESPPVHIQVEGRVGCSDGRNFVPLSGIKVNLDVSSGEQLTHHVSNERGQFTLNTTVWHGRYAGPFVSVVLTCRFVQSDYKFEPCDKLSIEKRVILADTCKSEHGQALVYKKQLKTQHELDEKLKSSFDIELFGEDTTIEYHKNRQTKEMEYASDQPKTKVEHDDKQPVFVHIEGVVGCSVGGNFEPLTGIQVNLDVASGERLDHYVSNSEGKYQLIWTVWGGMDAGPFVNVALSCDYLRSDSKFAACDSPLLNGKRETLTSMCEANPGRSFVVKKQLKAQKCSMDIDLDSAYSEIKHHKDPQTTELQAPHLKHTEFAKDPLPKCTA